MRLLLALLSALLLYTVSSHDANAQDSGQCVTSAEAGGTANALTVPMLACFPTTQLLVMLATQTTTTTTPTLQVIGSNVPAAPIKAASGALLVAGDIAANTRYLLTYDGTNWYLLNAVEGSTPTVSDMITPQMFGAVGNGVHDDTAAIIAAFAYLTGVGGGKLYAVNGSNYAISSTVTVPANTCFIGAGIDDSQLKMLAVPFTPMVSLGDHACMEDMRVDATPQTGTGVAIQLGTNSASNRAILRRVYTNKGCIGIDVNGVLQTVEHSFVIEPDATAGCGGIRVGHNTTSGNTVEFRLTDTLIGCNAINRADYNLKLEDSGGMFFGPNDDFIQCLYGTIIKPGLNQEVAFTAATSSYIGDTTLHEGLLIDTGDVTARVRSNEFIGTWTANSQGESGVLIQNTGGGKIAGTRFVGHRSVQNFFNGVWIKAPVSGTITDTSFDAGIVCNTQSGTDFLIGDGLSATVQNSRIGKQCDDFIDGNTVGLTQGIGVGNNVTLIATGNDFTYSGGETWFPLVGTPVVGSVIANNKGISNTPIELIADRSGTVDSTTQINAWLATASATNPVLSCPAGTYKFTDTLVGPTNLNNFTIIGAGSTQCVFKYTGAANNIDLFTGGNTSTNVSGWNLSGFRITSTTTMTAGTALHLKRLSQSRVSNVYTDCTDQTNGQKLWNGFWFQGIHEVALDNFCSYGLNNGVQLSGIDGTSSNDFWLNNGHLDFNAGVGLLLGGKIGIVWVDDVELIGNGGAGSGAQIRLDETLHASCAGCVGLVLSDTVHADGLRTNGNYVVEVNDTTATGGIIVVNGTLGSAVLDGLKLTSWPSGTVAVNGRIFNNIRDGIRVDDTTTKLALGASAFVDSNGAYGVNATGSTTNISTWARTFTNTTADYAANTNVFNPYAASMTFSPTVTCGSGAANPTAYTATGSWQPIGNTKLVTASVDITITTNGACATSLNFTLPTTAARTTAVPLGREIVTSGLMLTVTLTATSNVAATVTYANAYPAVNTSRIIGTITYERQ